MSYRHMSYRQFVWSCEWLGTEHDHSDLYEQFGGLITQLTFTTSHQYCTAHLPQPCILANPKVTNSCRCAVSRLNHCPYITSTVRGLALAGLRDWPRCRVYKVETYARHQDTYPLTFHSPLLLGRGFGTGRSKALSAVSSLRGTVR